MRKDKNPIIPREKTPAEPGPKVLRVTPEGRREVDPFSIIGSESVRTHLNEINKLDINKP